MNRIKFRWIQFEKHRIPPRGYFTKARMNIRDSRRKIMFRR